ncbi:MAG: nucleoside hydrolase-like domain-containing protein [Limisphaerales bacterium]
MAPTHAVELGTSGSWFTLDGQPTFLRGVSYYGALGASEDSVRRDLDDLRRDGFNWIRVWATWAAFTNDVSAVTSEGAAREPFLGRLDWLVGECDRRGMVVDVTLSRGNGVTGPTRLQTLAAHRRAVETLITRLAAHRNWYLDLANERNIRDARFVSTDELRQLREGAKRLDPRRLITASHAGGDLGRDEVRKYLLEARVDFLAPHRPREAGSALETETKTREALDWMRELGRVVPVHYQEPFRRGYGGWQPLAKDFLDDLRGARAGGAAGWCLHNGDTRGRPDGEPRRSFDLRESRLFEQWDDEEQSLLAALRRERNEPWPEADAADVGLDAARLRAFSEFVGGRGCVARHGRLVFSWGDTRKAGDVASAAKPVFSHFLFKAVEDGRIPSLEERVARWEPRLAALNESLGHKDAGITWRHLANQTSGYGVAERPGTAFCYNDWQMALFIDLLFNRVYATPWGEVDAAILHPRLTELLGCEDGPTLVAFGENDRPGRLAISPRDFARFGQLYLQRGRWQGQPLIREDLAVMAVHGPLPATLPRAGNKAAEMLPGQRTLGSQKVPDNQTDHFGGYSWLWWVNGFESGGSRHWPEAPIDTFAALGHGGKRGVAVMPSLQLVASWNDARLQSPAQENEAFGLLARAVVDDATVRPQSVEASRGPAGGDRLRVIVETDAGGDPDDEQSLVRFLLYANEWDLEGIIANRPVAREGENRNPERTGLGVVRRLLTAYGQSHSNLARHDPRFPSLDTLWQRTVAGYNDTEEAVNLIVAAVDRPDPRPVWYADWGTDHGGSTNNLRRALDRVWRERGSDGYAAFKARLRLASADAFGPHTFELEPAFPLWVDTFRPELERQRWYHRFSALTARAGGFDLRRDALQNHGPLGALYPTNTTHGQKEGDTMTFLYLVPTGMNDPERPEWGSWAGRYGPQTNVGQRAYFWANPVDAWHGSTNRDNTLRRWAADLQNDFKARLDWCAQPPDRANHPPQAKVDRASRLTMLAGEEGLWVAAGSSDPDGDRLTFEWIVYPEAGTFRGAIDFVAEGPVLRLRAPPVSAPETVHVVLRVTDDGDPPLSRYERVICTVLPRLAGVGSAVPGDDLAPAFTPPPEYANDRGAFRSVMTFDDGRTVKSAADWPNRRRDILDYWHRVMGPWPPLIERPDFEIVSRERRENFMQQRVRFVGAPGQTSEGWLLIPDGPGPFPAVLVPFYEPETSIGLGKPGRDFAYQLTRRGFVTLAIGSPGADAWRPDLAGARCQPLSYLAYLAVNAANALGRLPSVDARRIGVVGHSYGGKWALFAGALGDPFAAVAVSDPGIVWDESRPNVNYWEPWYLGRDDSQTRSPGVITASSPRTGAYRELVESGRDLHELLALIAPRPFLLSGGSEDPPERWRALNHAVAVNQLLGVERRVAMTSRPEHDPSPESNAVICSFFEHFLGSPREQTVVPELR